MEKLRAQSKALLHIRWQGGAVEDLSVALPVSAPDKVRYPVALVNRVRSLAASLTDTQIAIQLHQEGLLSAKGKQFTRNMVSWIRYRYGIPTVCLKDPDELTVNEVAEHFGVRPGVVYYWIQGGHLPARRLQPGSQYWITLSSEKEAELRTWVASSNRIIPPPTKDATVRGAI